MVARIRPQSPALTSVRRREALHSVVENFVAIAVDGGVGNESIHEINASACSGSSHASVLSSRDAIAATGQDASGAGSKSHHPAGIPFDDGVMNSRPEHNAHLVAGADNVVRNTGKSCAKIYLQSPGSWGPWETQGGTLFVEMVSRYFCINCGGEFRIKRPIDVVMSENHALVHVTEETTSRSILAPHIGNHRPHRVACRDRARAARPFRNNDREVADRNVRG